MMSSLKSLVIAICLILSNSAPAIDLLLNGNYHSLKPNDNGLDSSLELRGSPWARYIAQGGIARHSVAGIRWRYLKGAIARVSENQRSGINLGAELGSGDTGAQDFNHFIVNGGGYFRLASFPVVLDAEMKYVDSNGPSQLIGSAAFNFAIHGPLWARIQYTGAKTEDVDELSNSWLARADYAHRHFSVYLGYSNGKVAIDETTRRLLGGNRSDTTTLFGGIGMPIGNYEVRLGVSRFKRDNTARTTVGFEWIIPLNAPL